MYFAASVAVVRAENAYMKCPHIFVTHSVYCNDGIRLADSTHFGGFARATQTNFRSPECSVIGIRTAPAMQMTSGKL